jgi:hypothetical protein
VFDAPLWNREHFELFLRPGPSSRSVIQIGISSDGATETIGHGFLADSLTEWRATTEQHGAAWRVQLEIPLDKWAGEAGCKEGADWLFLAGFGMLTGSADWTAWQERGHDPCGVVADPLFADPAAGDFRLPSASPALTMGFVPLDLSSAGPQPR